MSLQSFPQEIKIGSRFVGANHPTYFIVDIGANFDGSLEKAKALALAAKEAGADCAKFQSFLADKIVSGKGFASMQLKGVHGSWGRPVEEVFKEAEFPRAWHAPLAAYCKEIGIDFTSAPYDFEAVDLLNSLDVPFIKIGSGEITWHEMLEYIAKKGRPMMLATGASTLAEVDEAVRCIEATGNRNLVLMQCITNYPSKIESTNLNVLKTYATAFQIITGYSGNLPGDMDVYGAVALGARAIEKHFTLNKKDPGPDHPHSIEPAELKQMIANVRALEAALGSTRKEVVPEESETVIVQRRGLYVSRDMKKGEVLKKADIVALRPALGILLKFKDVLVGKHVARALRANDPLRWEDVA